MTLLAPIHFIRLSVICLALLLNVVSTDYLFSQATDQQLLEFTRDREKHQRVTQYPVWMDYAKAIACKRPSQSDASPSTPHTNKAIHVYCDAGSLAAMWDPYAKFDEGSIIIKEKFDPYADDDKIEMFTGMLKREKGFAPDVGDWEFFTVSADAKSLTSRGKLESCMECHRKHPNSDFVTKSYSAFSSSQLGVRINGQWTMQSGLCNGSGETVYLPAALATTKGKKLTRFEASQEFLSREQPELLAKNQPNTNARNDASQKVPEDLSSLGGPKLRYEPELNKNTLGYWTEVDDSASWQIAFEKPGRYQVSVYQGCGTGNGGSQVVVSMANQKLEFTVVDTLGFQNFRWLEIGELTVDAAGQLELIVKPKTKAANAVMDLQQIRLKLIGDR